jgi:hypothetical protein
MSGFNDEEAVNNSSGDARTGNLDSLKASIGWYFPEVKLASWDPENKKQWKVSEKSNSLFCSTANWFLECHSKFRRFLSNEQNGGRAIATRNLLVSVPNLFCAFGVWLVWSVISSKIQLMHDKDPNVYPFEDWGSPKGADYNVLLYALPAVAGLSGGPMVRPR